AGTIGVDAGGGFDVNGTHTYAEEGSDPIKITITDTVGRNDTGGEKLIANTSATVTDAALAALPVTFNGNEGRSLNTTVATFVDANAAAPVGDFSAIINWGDGNVT